MASIVYQSFVDEMMATILQLADTNKIFGDQIKQLDETSAFLAKKFQEDKKATNNNDSYLAKLYPIFTHGRKFTKGHSSRPCKANK